MNANSLFNGPVASHANRPVQDEWGVFDPQQAGSAAVARALRDASPSPATGTAALIPPSDPASAAHCRYCTETLPAGAHQCPLCLREVGGRVAEPRGGQMTTREIPSTPPAETIPSTTPLSGKKIPLGAVYTLESPVRCPECDVEIGTISVLRVLRTQVSFTSTLPRKAYVIACPECRRLLSAGLSGLL